MQTIFRNQLSRLLLIISSILGLESVGKLYWNKKNLSKIQIQYLIKCSGTLITISDIIIWMSEL